jgi:hypothetical protein
MEKMQPSACGVHGLLPRECAQSAGLVANRKSALSFWVPRIKITFLQPSANFKAKQNLVTQTKNQEKLKRTNTNYEKAKNTQWRAGCCPLGKTCKV